MLLNMFGQVALLICCRWDELAEKPPEGQWNYFQRDRHTGQTQSP